MRTLEQTAQAAGLRDMDLLKLVSPDVPPALAMSNLQRRYPDAFAKHARDMTPAEFKAAVAALAHPKPVPLPDNLRMNVGDMTLAEKEAFERHHGIQVGTDERRRRERVRAEQQRPQEMGR